MSYFGYFWSISITCFNPQQYYRRNQIPAFGSWDCNDDIPFTQCFESARQASLIRCSYSSDRDLYVTGDLYENNIVTPAIIVAPRPKVIKFTAYILRQFKLFICLFRFDITNEWFRNV